MKFNLTRRLLVSAIALSVITTGILSDQVSAQGDVLSAEEMGSMWGAQVSCSTCGMVDTLTDGGCSFSCRLVHANFSLSIYERANDNMKEIVVCSPGNWPDMTAIPEGRLTCVIETCFGWTCFTLWGCLDDGYELGDDWVGDYYCL